MKAYDIINISHFREKVNADLLKDDIPNVNSVLIGIEHSAVLGETLGVIKEERAEVERIGEMSLSRRARLVYEGDEEGSGS